MEKYMFDCITRNDELTEDGVVGKSYNNTPVVFTYNEQYQGNDKLQVINMSIIDSINSFPLKLNIYSMNNVIIYENNASTINGAIIGEDIPDMVKYTNYYKLTLYYRER